MFQKITSVFRRNLKVEFTKQVLIASITGSKDYDVAGDNFRFL